MIHIATVHWKATEWIDLQLRFLREYVPEPYRVYAWLDELVGGPEPHLAKFHYTRTDHLFEHADKLNGLAATIAEQAESDDDLLLFIDSDAFPVRALGPFLEEKLAAYPLVAVQRYENNGDLQPHPCFCATTVGFWKRIKGDWSRGFQWPDKQGKLVTDVGGNLLGTLQKEGFSWHPMLRSNKKNPHPILFALYEDTIYHQGAGSRIPVTRNDLKDVKSGAFFERLHVRIMRRLTTHSLIARAYRLVFILWCRIMLGKQTFEAMRAGRELKEAIRTDFDFYRRLT